jgi:hypothetical protein
MFMLLFAALERVGNKISERLQLLPGRKHPCRPAYLREAGALLSLNARTGLSWPPGLGSLKLLNVNSVWVLSGQLRFSAAGGKLDHMIYPWAPELLASLASFIWFRIWNMDLEDECRHCTWWCKHIRAWPKQSAAVCFINGTLSYDDNHSTVKEQISAIVPAERKITSNWRFLDSCCSSDKIWNFSQQIFAPLAGISTDSLWT